MKVAADRYAGAPAPVEDGASAAVDAVAHAAHAEHATTEEDKFRNLTERPAELNIFCDRQN
jgi:hypothetical protein